MFDKSVDVISLLFPEICICLYFLYSKCYIKGKTGMGVKLSTMKKDLIVLNIIVRHITNSYPCSLIQNKNYNYWV